MSNSNSSDFELDQDLQLLPAWARLPASVNRYAHYQGGEEEPRQRGRGERPFRRDRERGESRGPARPAPRREESRPAPGRPGREFKGRPAERRPEPPRPPEEPLPEVLVHLIPEKRGVESLARQIRLTGRAYPLFQIAILILKRPERFEVQFQVKKGADGQVLQPLWVCSLDETVWLSQDEVAHHVLQHHFDTFYQTEKVPCEPPKGTYTFVAQCGLSGALLGPPNYHDYQNKLRKLHSERFSHLPFEAYKARVKIVRDEAVVKRWIEEQSWKCEYIGLNLPEPMRFTDRDQVEKHFREVHLPNLVRSVDTHTLGTPESHRYMSRGLRALLRHTLEEQRRFPLKVATHLSQQLGALGLQFFKVNKTVTHVCVARPHHLDLNTVTVSEGVRRIVEFIEAHPGCTRRQLIDTLAPAPPPPPVPESAPATNGAAAAPSAPEPGPTPEQAAIIADLHWLIHQGHVIEFTDGRMETAKPPKPKPTPPTPSAPPAPKAGSGARASAPESAPAAVPAEPPRAGATADTPATPTEMSGAAVPSDPRPAAAAGSVSPGDCSEAPPAAEPTGEGEKSSAASVTEGPEDAAVHAAEASPAEKLPNGEGPSGSSPEPAEKTTS